MPRVTPYSPPIFWPPVPDRKPAQGQTQTVTSGMAVNSPMASAEAKPGYTAVVPITPFGAVPPAEPTAPGPPQAKDSITFTVRLPTIVMLESKP